MVFHPKNDHDSRVFFNPINNPVSVIDTSRPFTGKIPFQLLYFACTVLGMLLKFEK